MAKDRTSMQRAEQVKLLIERGYSKRSIQMALRISHRTFNKIRGLGVAVMTISVADGLGAGLDGDYIHNETNKRGTTIKQLHRELVPDVPYLTTAVSSKLSLS
jgi:arginine decarboxylase-like protein